MLWYYSQQALSLGVDASYTSSSGILRPVEPPSCYSLNSSGSLPCCRAPIVVDRAAQPGVYPLPHYHIHA